LRRRELLTVVSLLKHNVRTRMIENATSTDLRGFFEAKEDPLSSRALFLSLIIASEGESEQW
jgi:hypothetical protein